MGSGEWGTRSGFLRISKIGGFGSLGSLGSLGCVEIDQDSTEDGDKSLLQTGQEESNERREDDTTSSIISILPVVSSPPPTGCQNANRWPSVLSEPRG